LASTATARREVIRITSSDQAAKSARCEVLNDGLFSEPVTPSVAARSAAFALRVDVAALETSSSMDSLGRHIVAILELQPLLALLAWEGR
jgi:hypothetical protein